MPTSPTVQPQPGTSVHRSPVTETQRTRLAAALQGCVRGEVRFDSAHRAVYATDSSNYRQEPLGVIFPRDADDVAAAVRVCGQFNAPILARGAGTGLAGQTVNVAVVLDFSRHMNAILDIDPDRRIARVQPGVVLDDLRARVAPYGLTFGPDPATHAWCTLGGMIGNNSCGTHALYAGKTVDNISRLRIVTASAHDLWVGRYSAADYTAAVAAGGELPRLLGGLREIGRRHAQEIRGRFPDIPRRVSGYNLDQILPTAPTHLARLLVGSESTLALTVEAEVQLAASPAHRHLVVLGYPDIAAAADAVPHLIKFGLLGLEGIDNTLVEQASAIGIGTDGIALLPPGRGWLLAEIGDDDRDTAETRTREFISALPETVTTRRFEDPDDIRSIWHVREAALGVTAHPPGQARNYEGWEDAAVPPDRLGEYLRRMSSLWTKYGYSGSWYGHFGQGCMHTRQPFDLNSKAGLADFRNFLTEAADLVVSLGGSLSGEHGDGQARGELLERMFGHDIIGAFRDVKTLFDPHGLLNPGKLVDPYPLDTNLRYGPSYRRTAMATDTAFAFASDDGSLQVAAERCVGVGQCRRHDTGVMCPSYRATGDERHSTRGRAKLLVEMFTGETTPRSWNNPDVHDAMQLCLACKGCKTDCPTGVDMATYKAEFNYHFYKHRIRPRSMYTLGLLPWAARIATRFPRTASRLLSARRLGQVLRHASGVTTSRPAPEFAPAPFRRTATARRCASQQGTTVVLWPDTFTNAFDPQLGEDTVAVLEAVGEVVHIPPAWACCGRTLFDPGMLDLAKRSLTQVLDILEPFIATGIPVIVPEPSCLSTFRDELPNLLADDPRAAQLARSARSLTEHLTASGALQRIAAPPPTVAAPKGRVLLHPHCQGRATVGTDADRTALDLCGYQTHVLDAGCCGLAGSFGYAQDTASLSKTIAHDHWLPRLREAVESLGPESILAMDGFSCITQLDQLDKRPHRTVASLIREALTRGDME